MVTCTGMIANCIALPCLSQLPTSTNTILVFILLPQYRNSLRVWRLVQTFHKLIQIPLISSFPRATRHHKEPLPSLFPQLLNTKARTSRPYLFTEAHLAFRQPPIPSPQNLECAMSTITLETPLAEALSSAVHSKIVEEGWTQDDDTSLAEYIVLMMANGKTQDQIASELAGELLQDAKGTTEFAQWLFDQVNILSGGSAPAPTTSQSTLQSAQPDAQVSNDQSSSADNGNSVIPAAYDTDMVDNAPENA